MTKFGNWSFNYKHMFMIKNLFFALAVIFVSCSIFFSCRKELIKDNKQPIASAGRDTIIVLPRDSVTLDGSGSNDPDGSISKYQWSKVSGPSTFSIVSSQAARSTIKNLSHGTYQIELTVTDNGGMTGKDTVMITVDSVAVINHPPIADAGADQAITLPTDSVTLDGSQSVDPDNNISAYQWTKIAGPSSFNILNTNAVLTLAASLVAGVYEFELNVTDSGGLSAKDTIKITVDSVASTNHSPIANAGPDQVIILPANTISLDGRGSSDPDNNITGYIWTSISGASLVQISNTTEIQAQVSSLIEGVYQFELKVTDASGLSSRDTVTITVDKAVSTNCGTNRPELNATRIPVGNLSKPRSAIAVASAGNKILFAGGISNDEPYGSSRVEIYDIVTNSWSTAELSAARYSITAISVGNKILFGGGFSGEVGDLHSYHSNVDIYDASNNTWSLAFLSEAREGIAAAAVGNKVFFAGGNGNGTWTNKVDIYDVTANTWSTSILSESKTSISAVTVDNKIYFAGGSSYGNSANSLSERIDIYDNATNSWSTSTLSEPKTVSGIAVGNKIYWAGGYNGQSELCKVEIRDLNTQTTSFEYLSFPAAVKAILRDNKIIFHRSWDSKFDIYDVNMNTWSLGVMPINIVGAAIISVNNTIYIAGGYTGDYNIISTEVWKLEF
jgi:PKD domain/Kelch motif